MRARTTGATTEGLAMDSHPHENRSDPVVFRRLRVALVPPHCRAEVVVRSTSDPFAPFVVWHRGFAGAPLDFIVEESRDGIDWVAGGAPVTVVGD